MPSAPLPRGAAAEADDERVLRIRDGAPSRGGRWCGGRDHLRPVAGLVQAVDEEHPQARASRVHLTVAWAPSWRHAAFSSGPVAAREGDVERIGHGRRCATSATPTSRARRGPGAAGRRATAEPRRRTATATVTIDARTPNCGSSRKPPRSEPATAPATLAAESRPRGGHVLRAPPAPALAWSSGKHAPMHDGRGQQRQPPPDRPRPSARHGVGPARARQRHDAARRWRSRARPATPASPARRRSSRDAASCRARSRPAPPRASS